MLSNQPQIGPQRPSRSLQSLFVYGVWLVSGVTRMARLTTLMVCFAFLAGCRDTGNPQPVSDQAGKMQSLQWDGRSMGTTYRITLWVTAGNGVDNALDQAMLEQQVEERLEQINQRMSTYRQDSELSRFNAASANQWFSVSPETADVVATALYYHKATQGALDVTIGPLMRIWGFNPQRQLVEGLPNQEQIQEVLTRVGAQHLQVRSKDRSALQKTVDGLEIDLSAIAKGYAVDQLVVLLKRAGAAGGLVEIGGEVRTWGHRPDGRLWRVGIENPLVAGRMLAQIINLDDAALATSGDYRNFHAVETGQVSHLIDPVTGLPRMTGPMSVSVCAKTCMESDALATALFLMGQEKGLAWSETHGVAAMYLTVENGRLVEKHSSRFESYLQ